MRAAREEHEARSRNERRQESSLLVADIAIVPTVNHERWNADLREQVPRVTSAVTGHDVAGRRVGIRRRALHLIEVSDQTWIGVAAKELTGEDLPKCRC